MDTPASEQSEKAQGVAALRACDECRTRKTRCDRTSPCSHCRAFGLVCRTTTQRTKEHKDRIHVTKQYENKIDRIDHRLARLEQLLQESRDFARSSSSSKASLQADSPASSRTWDQSSNISQVDHGSSAPPHTGDVGPHAESIAAKNVLEQTVISDPTIHQDSQLGAALETLRRIVSQAHTDTSGPESLSPALAPESTSQPLTWAQVEAVLKRLGESMPATFNWLPPALLDDFRRKCRSMYQQGNPGSPTDKVLVYSIMSNMCSEFSGRDQGSAADHYQNLCRKFSNMLLEALATFPVLTPPCMTAIEALMMAATTMVSICKPSLTWSITSTAARMCQALGYNRLSRVDPNSDPLFHRKVVLFWCIYILDRSNSIRLGRAPAIHDDDIDTPMASIAEDSPAILVALLDFWVACARVQGKICVQLYGPSAALLAPNERARIAEMLADELEQIHARKFTANNFSAMAADLHASSAANKLMVSGESVKLYSGLTMALYAIPASHPHYHRALDTARKCLRLVVKTRSEYPDVNVYTWTVYCHWILLDSSLTPFTGIFCNIVANPQSSQPDLELLEQFVALLQPAGRVSEGVEKFHQLCAIFVNVARAYMRAKAQTRLTNESGQAGFADDVSQFSLPAIGEFDEHLAALGFFGPQPAALGGDDHPPMGYGFSGNSILNQQKRPVAAPSLLDWYSGHVSLYSLLEQDLDELASGYLE